MSKATYLLLASILLVTIVSGDALNSPLRFRLSQPLLKELFRINDKYIHERFKNINLGHYELDDNLDIEDLIVSLEPQSGDFKNFDMPLVFSDNKVKIESNQVYFRGTGDIVH